MKPQISKRRCAPGLLSMAPALLVVLSVSFEVRAQVDPTDAGVACGSSSIDEDQTGCLESADSLEELLLPDTEQLPELAPNPDGAPPWTALTSEFVSTCVGGPNHGQVCDGEEGCPEGECEAEIAGNAVCLGGTNDGLPCLLQSECTGGGQCAVRVCVGGPNHLEDCVMTTDCPGGVCTLWDGVFDADDAFSAEEPEDAGCFPDLCSTIGGRVFSPDERVRITATKTFPWRTIGRLTMTWPVGGSTSCSGALYGERHVLTSGHCIHTWRCRGGSKKGKSCISNSDCPSSSCRKYWAKSVKFRAGQNKSKKPYGTAKATRIRTFTSWVDSRDTDFDMAFVLLNKRVGKQTGWMGYGTGSNTGQIRNLSGYPGDKSTGTQWFDHDPVTAEDAYQMDYVIDTFSGQSGSPVWRYTTSGTRTIRAVHRCCTTGSTNQGVRINSGKYNAMQKFKSDYPLVAALAGDDCALFGCNGINLVFDCNDNGVPDDDDITATTSLDGNGNGIPDECEGPCCLGATTCDDEHSALSCLDAGGTFPVIAPASCLGDTNGNGTDDVCEIGGIIPAASEWGLMVLIIGILCCGTIVMRRRVMVA